MVHALINIIRETSDLPTVDAVAAHANVSKRTVFRLFEDLASLNTAMVDVTRKDTLSKFPPPTPEGSIEERIRMLIEHRVAIYEYIMPIRRVAERLRDTHPDIARTLDSDRRGLHTHINMMFGDYVQRFGDDAAERLDGIELATSWYSWRSLRLEQGCPVDRAKRIVERTVRHLLGVEKLN